MPKRKKTEEEGKREHYAIETGINQFITDKPLLASIHASVRLVTQVRHEVSKFLNYHVLDMLERKVEIPEINQSYLYKIASRLCKEDVAGKQNEGNDTGNEGNEDRWDEVREPFLKILKPDPTDPEKKKQNDAWRRKMLQFDQNTHLDISWSTYSSLRTANGIPPIDKKEVGALVHEIYMHLRKPKSVLFTSTNVNVSERADKRIRKLIAECHSYWVKIPNPVLTCDRENKIEIATFDTVIEQNWWMYLEWFHHILTTIENEQQTQMKRKSRVEYIDSKRQINDAERKFLHQRKQKLEKVDGADNKSKVVEKKGKCDRRLRLFSLVPQCTTQRICIDINKSTAKELLGVSYASKTPADFWEKYFNWTRIKNHAKRRFAGRIVTNGIKCSVMYTRPKSLDTPEKVKQKKTDATLEIPKPKAPKFIDLQTEVKKKPRVVGIDPGRRDLFVATDMNEYDVNKPSVLSVSTKKYYQMIGARRYTAKRNDWLKKAGDGKIKAMLQNTPTAKVSSTEAALVHANYDLQHLQVVLDYYFDPKHKKLKWRTQCQIKRTLDKLSGDVLRPFVKNPKADLSFEKEPDSKTSSDSKTSMAIERDTAKPSKIPDVLTFVGFGDGSFSSSSKGHASGPVKAFQHRLKARCKEQRKKYESKFKIRLEETFASIDEHSTSKLCHMCHKKLEAGQHYKQSRHGDHYRFEKTYGVKVCVKQECYNKRVPVSTGSARDARRAKLATYVNNAEILKSQSLVTLFETKLERTGFKATTMNRDVNAAMNIRMNYVLGRTLRPKTKTIGKIKSIPLDEQSSW